MSVPPALVLLLPVQFAVTSDPIPCKFRNADPLTTLARKAREPAVVTSLLAMRLQLVLVSVPAELCPARVSIPSRMPAPLVTLLLSTIKSRRLAPVVPILDIPSTPSWALVELILTLSLISNLATLFPSWSIRVLAKMLPSVWL